MPNKSPSGAVVIRTSVYKLGKVRFHLPQGSRATEVMPAVSSPSLLILRCWNEWNMRLSTNQISVLRL